MLKISSILIAALLMQTASAAEPCDGVSQVLAQSAAIPATKVVASACKPWPHDRNLLLSASAFDTGAEDDKLLVVAVVDATARRVVSRYQVMVGEDAAVHIGPRSLSIDTARYQLAPGVRAFGVRFASDARGASCPDGIWTDELTLFVAEGKTLRPVMRGMPMSRSEARKGMFCGAAQELVYDEARLTLGVAASASRGYADLVVSARVTRFAGDQQGAAKTERQTLRYDGKEYRAGKNAPWWLSFFPLGE